MKNLSLFLMFMILVSAVLLGGCSISNNTATTTYYYYPNWTPDGKILCSKNIQTISGGSGATGGSVISSEYYIATMNIDGSNETNVKRIGNGAKVAASPLGNYYAYAETSSKIIYIINTSGTDINPIDYGATVDSLDWSPDEAKLVYGTKTSATSEVYTVNRDGSAKVFLTYGENVAWKYGTRLFFEFTSGIYTYLGSINSDGTGFHDYGGKSVNSPQILSTNTNYCFGKASEAYRKLDVSSSPEAETIMFSPFNGYLPKLSKNGDKVVYTNYSTAGIWIIDITGTGETKLR